MSTLGIPVMENNSLSTTNVSVYSGTWTWNEAFQTCSANGEILLKIDSDDVYPTISKLFTKYPGLQS